MKKFNVLDRHLHIHQHYLLEASAGTGKTFSIQNIVVRLLIESSEPLVLNQILVVTFTRAATRDLRLRIRANIEQALHYLNEWLHDSTLAPAMPDYLVAITELGKDQVRQAKKRLQQALFAFDQAPIFTIHSFCSRMLRQYAIESDMGFHAQGGEEALPPSEVMSVIRDFFHTGIRPEAYSVGQLAIVLKEDPDQRKLLRAVQSGYDFEKIPTFTDYYTQFVEVMKSLKSRLNGLNMFEDFQAQYSSYRSYKAGETKAEMLEKVERFTALFEKDNWSHTDFDMLLADGVVWVAALDPSLLKNRAPVPQNLFYPTLRQELKDKLEPLVRQASSFSYLLCRLARDCQTLLRRYQVEEEKLSPDDLLKKMEKALEQPHFLAQIQKTYQAAIIDEFQDTDPLQWQIFRQLFIPENHSWTGYLYLVGDPKQSIYSFRQADIYTYLSAAQILGEDYCFSLDTNYRSQPSLVEALNTLFSTQHVPSLIPLPKQDFHLPYQPVHFSETTKTQTFHDDKGAIHFFIADGKEHKRATLQELENQVFFPFIVNEIKSLGMEYRQFSILVRDRYQALRLADYLDGHHIPYLNQRGTSLAESVALSALVDLIRAILHPYDLGIAKTALGGPLIAWTHDDLKGPNQLDSTIALLRHLRQGLVDHGFSYFFQEFLDSSWQPDGLTVLERMLKRENGQEMYHDLQQIADIIVDHQYHDWNGPEGLVPFLDQFYLWEADEDERVKRFQDPSKNGVKILTLHVSKGLEFDVVFALGLVNRVGAKDDLIPIERNGKRWLVPMLDDRSEYQDYFEEVDAEKMRQLYVAMTRAKYRLYLPLAWHLSTSQLDIGDASPMDLFLARLGKTSISYADLYQQIKQYDGASIIQFLNDIAQHHITYSIHQTIEPIPLEMSDQEEKKLEPPRQVHVTGESLYISSFSSMAHSTPSLVKIQPPHDFGNENKNVHTLPASQDTGILLHTLLEKISFTEFQSFDHPEESLSAIRSHLHQPAFKPWELPISHLIFNTLKTPLPIGSFCLADIPASHLYKEMPFLYSSPGGFTKGVIDLVFSHEGKYYIVDWKSNWLGPHEEAYKPDQLHVAMMENQYFMQAHLYTDAFKRYLKLVEQAPFEECFGGVIYLFMRGIKPGFQTGIYHFFPQGLKS